MTTFCIYESYLKDYYACSLLNHADMHYECVKKENLVQETRSRRSSDYHGVAKQYQG